MLFIDNTRVDVRTLEEEVVQTRTEQAVIGITLSACFAVAHLAAAVASNSDGGQVLSVHGTALIGDG